MSMIKLGIFGARRGSSYAKAAMLTGLAEVTAVCDRDESSHANVCKHTEHALACFTDFDAMLGSGIDAVVLTNYFHKHAEFAIRAMERGVHVFSETTAAVTLAECAALCRTVEQTGCTYMLAENYPYFPAVQEMKRVAQGGSLGAVLYAEGEYVHPMSRQEYRNYTPNAAHWRAQMPSGYYLTHSLAPLMYMTDSMPKTVNAKSTYSTARQVEYDEEPTKDSATVMLCEMDNGALFRVTGWAKFGFHGSYYRLCCENGGIEMPRGQEERVKLAYNPWCVPEGAKEESVYVADRGTDADKAKQCGHGGGDYWVTKEFLESVTAQRQPFFDVYRACAMASVGILGWRSSLNHGAEYQIPDFRDENARKQIENDMLTPFGDAETPASYPNTKEEFYKK